MKSLKLVQYGFIISLLLCHSMLHASLIGESKTLKDAIGINNDYVGTIPLPYDFFSIDYDEVYNDLNVLYKATNDIDYLSDIGYLMILEKRYDEAIDLYLTIEQKVPNRFSTASNIGMAYELKGDNLNALKWIKRSMKIDPSAYNYAEWLHANILAVKIQGTHSTKSQSLIYTDFGSDVYPKSQLQEGDLNRLREQIYYQLRERTSFVKEKDPIIAQLFFEMGNIFFLQKRYHGAIRAFKKAKARGFEGELLWERLQLAREYSDLKPYKSPYTKLEDFIVLEQLDERDINQKYSFKDFRQFWQFILCGFGVFVGLVFFVKR